MRFASSTWQRALCARSGKDGGGRAGAGKGAGERRPARSTLAAGSASYQANNMKTMATMAGESKISEKPGEAKMSGNNNIEHGRRRNQGGWIDYWAKISPGSGAILR